MLDEEAEALVIDNGSGTIKAGFAGEDAPKVPEQACFTVKLDDAGIRLCSTQPSDTPSIRAQLWVWETRNVSWAPKRFKNGAR